MKILRFEIPLPKLGDQAFEFSITTPPGVYYIRSLHVDTKPDQTPCIHILTEDSVLEANFSKIDFILVATGHEFDEKRIKYIGTFKVCGGQYMYHVFVRDGNYSIPWDQSQI